ncbi:conserved Plasmodium protein, unknown function [Plasmodium malariae]|nr:conserved Plasmodium protein, unknown function [Plasmodium malariae]
MKNINLIEKNFNINDYSEIAAINALSFLLMCFYHAVNYNTVTTALSSTAGGATTSTTAATGTATTSSNNIAKSYICESSVTLFYENFSKYISLIYNNSIQNVFYRYSFFLIMNLLIDYNYNCKYYIKKITFDLYSYISNIDIRCLKALSSIFKKLNESNIDELLLVPTSSIFSLKFNIINSRINYINKLSLIILAGNRNFYLCHLPKIAENISEYLKFCTDLKLYREILILICTIIIKNDENEIYIIIPTFISLILQIYHVERVKYKIAVENIKNVEKDDDNYMYDFNSYNNADVLSLLRTLLIIINILVKRNVSFINFYSWIFFKDISIKKNFFSRHKDMGNYVSRTRDSYRKDIHSRRKYNYDDSSSRGGAIMYTCSSTNDKESTGNISIYDESISLRLQGVESHNELHHKNRYNTDVSGNLQEKGAKWGKTENGNDSIANGAHNVVQSDPINSNSDSSNGNTGNYSRGEHEMIGKKKGTGEEGYSAYSEGGRGGIRNMPRDRSKDSDNEKSDNILTILLNANQEDYYNKNNSSMSVAHNLRKNMMLNKGKNDESKFVAFLDIIEKLYAPSSTYNNKRHALESDANGETSPRNLSKNGLEVTGEGISSSNNDNNNNNSNSNNDNRNNNNSSNNNSNNNNANSMKLLDEEEEDEGDNVYTNEDTNNLKKNFYYCNNYLSEYILNTKNGLSVYSSCDNNLSSSSINSIRSNFSNNFSKNINNMLSDYSDNHDVSNSSSNNINNLNNIDNIMVNIKNDEEFSSDDICYKTNEKWNHVHCLMNHDVNEFSKRRKKKKKNISIHSCKNVPLVLVYLSKKIKMNFYKYSMKKPKDETLILLKELNSVENDINDLFFEVDLDEIYADFLMN